MPPSHRRFCKDEASRQCSWEAERERVGINCSYFPILLFHLFSNIISHFHTLALIEVRSDSQKEFGYAIRHLGRYKLVISIDLLVTKLAIYFNKMSDFEINFKLKLEKNGVILKENYKKKINAKQVVAE